MDQRTRQAALPEHGDVVSEPCSQDGRAASGTGVDEATGLASDFLNQFNEVVMLLDLLADGDETLIDELDAWRPCAYEAHFAASGYRDSDEVVLRYRGASALARRRLDALAGDLSALVLAGIVFLMSRHDTGTSVSAQAAQLAEEVRRRIDALDAVVHAGMRCPSQNDVSELFRKRRA